MPTTVGLLLGAIATWAVPMMLWWRLTGRGGKARRTREDRRRHESAPATAAAYAATEQPCVEWADPTRIWPALNAENLLLTALLAGLIPQADYRARMTELARRCEPAQPTKGDE